MALIEKPLKSNGKLRKKSCVQLMKKSPKLNKKIRKKIGDSINKKPFKLNKEIKRKINHLCLIYCFIGGKKFLKLS